MAKNFGYNLRRLMMQSGIRYRVWQLNKDVVKAFPEVSGGDWAERLAEVKDWSVEGGRWQKMTIGATGVLLVYVIYVIFSNLDLTVLKEKFKSSETAELRSAGLSLPDSKLKKLTAPSGGEQGKYASQNSIVTPQSEIVQPENSQGDNVVQPAVTQELEKALSEAAQTSVIPVGTHGLIASKKEKTLYVFRKASDRWAQVRKYPITTGSVEGNKKNAGDRRTPEGLYWITHIVDGPSQGPLYGTLIFKLNYPNPRDRAAGKSGSGIWIHGVQFAEDLSSTQGCISMTNLNALDLAQYASVGSPLVILGEEESDSPPNAAKQFNNDLADSEYVIIHQKFFKDLAEGPKANEDVLAKAKSFLSREVEALQRRAASSISEIEKQKILATLEAWREGWSERNIEAYGSSFHSDFVDRDGRDRKTFLDRKASIFNAKDSIHIDVSQVEIQQEESDMVSLRFKQEYFAEASGRGERSTMNKTMELRRDGDSWLIAKE